MPTLEPPCAAPSLSTESEGVRRELGDASGADTPDKQAALGEVLEGRSGCSGRAADEVPDEAGSVPDAWETEPEEAAALLSAKSMWTRALRMFTAGAGTPCNSAMGSVAEPATNELLMLIDDAANELFDAEERGELQLTAGPLDRIDARGFFLADVYSTARISPRRTPPRSASARRSATTGRRPACARTRQLSRRPPTSRSTSCGRQQ
jgi:hypothetical protein